MTGIFEILESLQLRNDTKISPQLKFFFMFWLTLATVLLLNSC